MYQVSLSPKFKKELEKEVRGDNKLWKQVTKTLHLLSIDVKHPSLRLHKLSGKNNWSVSITKSYRLIFSIEKNIIFCTKFGTHEEVY